MQSVAIERHADLVWSSLNCLNKKRYDFLLQQFGSLEKALEEINEDLLIDLGCKKDNAKRIMNRISEFDSKKEIGILRMIGAPKKYIYKLLLIKSAVLGIIGGILGYVLGTISGIYLGPVFAQIEVQPVYIYLLYSVLIAIGISIVGSIIPATMAAKIEPFSNMQEV